MSALIVPSSGGLVVPASFDWKRPDYKPVIAARVSRLTAIRANPSVLPSLFEFYRQNPAAFVHDWGVTADPRNVEKGLPATTPFLLFPRQVEWVEFIMECWRTQSPGITEKSRDSGVSWLAIALSCTLCLFNKGLVIGFGSRKEEYCDLKGSPKSLFEKARMFLQHIPPEYLGGWDREKHAPHMRIIFPGSGSAMSAEAGSSIGRGDRSSLFFVDESAFLESPETIDAALSATTNSRQDISTPNGFANSFAIRRHSGRIKVFTFHWSQDPRKGPEWYAKQKRELDSVTLAAEVDISYHGSQQGQLIPAEWITAAIDAHIKLGIEPTGIKRGALDIADEGKDLNAFAGRYGFMLQHIESWSGKGGDIFSSVVRAFTLCDELGLETFLYDADGLGAGARGDARRINEDRLAASLPEVRDEPFRGSAAPIDPEGELVAKRKNKDFFANLKAMAWWALRLRFQATYRAVEEKQPYNPDDIISIPSTLPELMPLRMELSQPSFSLSTSGKVVVNKTPDGAKSPNLADAVMIAFSPGISGVEVWKLLINQGMQDGSTQSRW